MRRTFGLSLTISALVSAVGFAQQAVPMTPPQAPKVTAPGPQRHQSPGQQQPAAGVPRTAPAPLKAVHAPYTGTIMGYVYWDASAINHKPSAACDGLAVTVSAGTTQAGTRENFTPVGTFNGFTYIANIGNYAVCAYAAHPVPSGQDLQVEVGVTTPAVFSPIAAPVSSNLPVRIINGKCNNLPPATPSPAALESHWWTCGDHAYNVNFVLQASAHLMGAPAGQGMLSGSGAATPGLLSQTSRKGMLANQGAGGAQPQAQPGSPVETASTPQRAGGASKVELNPQPLPPGGMLGNAGVIKMVKAGVPEAAIIRSIQSSPASFDLSPDALLAAHRAGVGQKVLDAMMARGSSSESIPSSAPVAAGNAEVQKRSEPLDPRLGLTLGPPKSGQQFTNPRAAQRTAGVLALLQKQRTVADAETAQMTISARPLLPGSPQSQPSSPGAARTMIAPNTSVRVQAAPSVGTVGPGQTLSAGSGTSGSALLQQPRANSLAPANAGGAHGAIPSNIAQLHPVNTTALTCSQDPAFRILNVSGSASAATFTPIDQYNLYTITGCSFGEAGPNNKAYIYGKGSFQGSFNIKFWSDNSIALSLDESISGSLDLDNVTLVVQRSDGQQTQKSGFKFYAARETVPLSTIPASWVKLVTLTDRFKKLTPQYSSPPSTNPGPGPSAGTAYVSRFYNGDKFDPTGVNDFYDFSRLAPGWTTDSFQLTTYDQNCPYVVTYRENFGIWRGDWDRDNIHVIFADTTCSGFNPTSPFLIYNYQNWTGSYYALKVWVAGPRGTDPLTGNRVQ